MFYDFENEKLTWRNRTDAETLMLFYKRFSHQIRMPSRAAIKSASYSILIT